MGPNKNNSKNRKASEILYQTFRLLPSATKNSNEVFLLPTSMSKLSHAVEICGLFPHLFKLRELLKFMDEFWSVLLTF